MINTLETLKEKAKKVQQEMAQSDKVMEEVDSVTNEYEELSNLSARIYFCQQSLNEVYSFYKYSLPSFMKRLIKLLDTNAKLQAIGRSEHKKRIETIMDQMFIKSYHKVYYSLLNQDKFIYA